MATHSYPGNGLSPSQLVFALNEELKRTAYSSSLSTLDSVSQLERDVSAALAAVREWKNSFRRINRIPSDVLSLIPTHLPQGGRFRTTFVCRHWRRVLLQCGVLWSQIFSGKGGDYVETLLRRAKGSTLDITADRHPHPRTLVPLSLRAQQIGNLKLDDNYSSQVSTFSEIVSGPLPLLRTLEISVVDYDFPPNEVDDPPSSPLFTGAVNLEQFVLSSWKLSLLSLFTFPNLTSFQLLTTKGWRRKASDLFTFLRASPALRTVMITIADHVTEGVIPQDPVVVLPNVETFHLHMVGNRHASNDPMGRIYNIAAHISCPRARNTALTHEMDYCDVTLGLEAFPASASWKTIVRNYTRDPVEEVVLEITPETYEYGVTGDDDYLACSLTIRSSNATVINLGFGAVINGGGHNLSSSQLEEHLIDQACNAIRYHPLVYHTRSLHIKYANTSALVDRLQFARSAGSHMIDFLESLEELTFDGRDLDAFLLPYLGTSWSGRLATFPLVKRLTIMHTATKFHYNCSDAMVELVKSRHAQGKPLERVTVRAGSIPMGLRRKLKPWVGVVDCQKVAK